MAVSRNNTSTGTGNTAGASTATVPHNCGSGASRYIRVGISYWDGLTTVVVSGVTYNGVAMTKIVPTFTNAAVDEKGEIWGLLVPDPGLHDIVATFNHTNVLWTIGASDYTGVDQSNPVGTPASNVATASTSTVTCSAAAGDMAVDVLTGISDVTAVAPSTQLWQNNLNEPGAGSDQPGAASVTFQWNLGGSFEFMAGAIALKAAATGASIPTTRRRMRRWDYR